MLDLPILPAGAMPAPAPGPSGSSQPSTDGASFEDALTSAGASTEAEAAPEETPTAPAPVTDEATLAALAALAGAATVQTVQVVVAPQAPVADAQPAGPTPDSTILVPVTKPGPRLELANPNPLAPTPQAGAQPEADAPVLEDAQPVRGALPTRGKTFGDVWVNLTQKAGEPDPQPTEATASTPIAAATTATPTPATTGAVVEAQPEAAAPTIKVVKATATEPVKAAATAAEAPPTPQPAASPTPTVAPAHETKAEPARLAEVQPQEVVAQIQRAVEQLEGQKLETIKVTLHPEELGRIELRVTHGADQGLQVSVRAEQPHTAAMLENHLTELRSNLSASGLDVASIAISTGLASQHQQSNRSFQNARSFGINLRGIKGGETDPYDSERPIVLRLNSARGWSAAGVDLSI